jgi:transcriptional regulator with XRE-family HTH domain
MLFAQKIKQLRDSQHLPQRQIAAVLEIDTATYCKIEKGDRRAKREQVLLLAKIFNCESDELLNIWLADKVYQVVKNEYKPSEVLNIVQESISEYGKK